MSENDMTTNQLAERFDGLSGKVEHLEVKVDGLSDKFDNLSNRFDELMDFLKENMVFRSDLENFMTKEEGRNLEHRIQIGLDQIIKMQQKFDVELVSSVGRSIRLEDRVEIIEKKFELV